MNKKLTSLALAAAITGVAGTAQAVNVSSNGEGEVLLYPFYTVEGGQDTYFSVTNTTSSVKAVKVRFKEGMNSQEVLDFNLYLSPNDMWTAAITDDPNGDGAVLKTGDSSCTVPSIPSGGVTFRNSQFDDDGVAQDSFEGEPSGFNTKARTREGYVELIEMGVVDSGGAASELATAATHVDGTPDDCGALKTAFSSGIWSGGAANTGISQPTGGLYGTGTIIDVDQATDASYSAVALSNFSTEALHALPSTSDPSLGDAFPPNATVIADDNLTAVTAGFGGGTNGGIDAVSAALMYASINNNYVLADGLNAGTDWVVTFPTKGFYASLPSGSTLRRPFTEQWNPVTTKACEQIGLTYYDREERDQQPDDLDFSPIEEEEGFNLCKEVNVVTFNESDVLDSSERLRKDLDVDFDNGWLNMSFTTDSAHTFTSSNGVTFNGLPVVGFSVDEYENGNVGGLVRNYAGLVEHKSKRDVRVGGLD